MEATSREKPQVPAPMGLAREGWASGASTLTVPQSSTPPFCAVKRLAHSAGMETLAMVHGSSGAAGLPYRNGSKRCTYGNHWVNSPSGKATFTCTSRAVGE
ncbi:MAG: hypothetical protein K1X89_14005 [Myxococcaceae bacterium]|nr:hypothetical protein [Myxococcaceae bacterium]